ncbi:MAG: alpha/beta hydrolase [Pseudomonadota bacterium]
MTWHLNEEVRTQAGIVRAGQAGDGPDLVLAHGWPWSSFSWHRVIPELTKRYRVHWYDMPGYGQSEMSGQRTSLDVQGEVFAELMAHWSLEKPNVLAHDFGGATTLRAHLLHGCNYARYVLMNVVAMRPWGSEFFEHVGRHVAAFQGMPSHIHAAVVEAYIKGALAHEIAQSDLEALIQPWLSEKGKDSFYSQFAQADERYTAEVEPHFKDIRCPVTVIWGEDDPWIPIARGRALAELIPHARFARLKGLGHLPQLEGPQHVLRALEEAP